MNKLFSAVRKMSVAILFLSSTLTIAPANAQVQDHVNIDLLTTVFGTGSYVMGTALEEISKKNSKQITINATETPGFIFNLRTLIQKPEARKNTIIGTGAGVLGLAAVGHKPFKEKHADVALLIGNYYIGTYWLATTNPNIKTVNDLEGKKIALGRAAQINWAVQTAAVIEEGYGLKGKVDIQYVGTEDAVAALLDGNVDAAIVGGYYDPLSGEMTLSPQTAELMASGRDITFISMGDEQIKKTVDSGIHMLSLYIDKNTIDNIDYDFNVIADTVSWAVSPEFSEETAYEITKLILNNIQAFSKYHALGKLMSREGLIYGWDMEDIHPGALRAYKEAGVL